MEGDSPRRLFARAAAAMFHLQGADLTRPIALARAANVQAGDRSSLLIAWLNALRLNQEIAGEMYSRFEINEISERGLRAVAYGYSGTPAHTAIKAATYYDLDVSPTADGWGAAITFDV